MVRKAGGSIRRKTKAAQVFCTTCGDALDDYCFSKNADDLKQVVKDLARCKQLGRFKGSFCAKLFIAGSDGSARISKGKRIPKRMVAELERAIRAEADKEEKGSPHPPNR